MDASVEGEDYNNEGLNMFSNKVKKDDSPRTMKMNEEGTYSSKIEARSKFSEPTHY